MAEPFGTAVEPAGAPQRAAGRLPAWAWAAAIAGGLVLGLVVLPRLGRGNGTGGAAPERGASDEGGRARAGGEGTGAAPPPLLDDALLEALGVRASGGAGHTSTAAADGGAATSTAAADGGAATSTDGGGGGGGTAAPADSGGTLSTVGIYTALGGVASGAPALAPEGAKTAPRGSFQAA